MSDSTVIPLPTRPRACTHAQTGIDCAHCDVRLIAVCSALRRDELASIERIAHTLCYAPKETLFLENDAADSAYTLTRGALRLYRVFADGRRQVIGFLLPGDFIGIEDDGYRRFSADAVTEVTLCHYPKRDFARLVDDKPHLLQQLYRTAAHDLIDARDHMMALGQRSAREKIAWFLIHLRNRFARGGTPSDQIEVPMSRQDIGDYLGLTIETVSRTLTRLAREGTVEISPRGITLKDARKIERLAAA
jgi:CRP/FNR family transcriptional regulator